MGKRNNYQRGVEIEYKIRAEFVAKGMKAVRSAGSHSSVDVFAWDNDHVYFIQSKRAKTEKGIGALKAEIKAFQDEPCPPWVRKEFRVWVDRKGFLYIWKNYEEDNERAGSNNDMGST